MKNDFIEGAADALEQYEAMARRYPRLRPEPAMGEPWRPVMTEQQQREHDQYVKDHQLPF